MQCRQTFSWKEKKKRGRPAGTKPNNQPINIEWNDEELSIFTHFREYRI